MSDLHGAPTVHLRQLLFGQFLTNQPGTPSAVKSKISLPVLQQMQDPEYHLTAAQGGFVQAA
jgi:hypothetical protein